MKKYIARMLIIGLLAFLCILFIAPLQLYANSVYYTEVNVFPGVANQNTEINVHVEGFNYSGYILTVLKFNGSNYVPYGSAWTGTVPSNDWNQTFNVTLPSGSYRAKLVVQYASDKTKDFYITTCDYEDEVLSQDTSWSYSTSCGNNISQIYIWADGNTWLMTSDGASPSISVNGIGTSTVTVNEGVLDVSKLRYYYNCCSSKASINKEPEPWVRGDRGMVCYQVMVNDKGCFEFVFWYEYKDNNWVKIYDENGSEVFSIDMPYGNASLEACLSDGQYTVKTFHNDMSTPLQEFMIGKPVPEAEM